MRLREILVEDYNSQLQSDLDNLLVGAKASGVDNINPEVVVRQMQKMGYSIDVDSLLTLLQDNPAIENASPESIHLTQDEAGVSGSAEETHSKVNTMAQK